MPNAPSLSPDAADEPKALAFIKEIFEHKKRAQEDCRGSCHAPWLLFETGIAKGRKVTS
jgi:protease I